MEESEDETGRKDVSCRKKNKRTHVGTKVDVCMCEEDREWRTKVKNMKWDKTEE